MWCLKAENEEEVKKWMSACIVHSKWRQETATPQTQTPFNPFRLEVSSLPVLLSKIKTEEGRLSG